MSKIIQLMVLLIYSLSVASVTAAGKENKGKGDSKFESSMEKRSDKGREHQRSEEKRHYGKYKIYTKEDKKMKGDTSDQQ